MSEEHEPESLTPPDPGGEQLDQQDAVDTPGVAEPIPDVADDDGGEEEGEAESDGAPAEGEGEQPEAQAPPLDQKTLEKMGKRLDKLRDSVKGRVVDILGEGAEDLIECPVCTTVAPGWLYPPNVEMLDEAQEAGMRALLGIDAPRELEHDPNTETCEVCKGEGFVKTGSRREGYKIRECTTCGAVGFVSKGAGDNGNVLKIVADAPGFEFSPAADVAGDPAVMALRERGFTVIPPPRVPA